MSAHGGTFTPDRATYIIVPDVGLPKGRVAIAALKRYASVWSKNGYAFTHKLPETALTGRVYAIAHIERYHPRELKRRYKGLGIEILKRDTSLSVDAVRKAIGARAGSDRVVAITSIAGENWFIEIKTDI